MQQELRMHRFTQAYEGYKRSEITCEEAGVMLGMSERQFRRLRDWYEDEGAPGILDRRLGKASAKRVMDMWIKTPASPALSEGALAGVFTHISTPPRPHHSGHLTCYRTRTF